MFVYLQKNIMDFDTLDKWCKFLEKNFTCERMIPTLPVIVRLDGVNFSKWTKSLNKPFDSGFKDLMIDTTKHLVKHTNAIVGYTQSDEITLILYSGDKKSEIYNGGKKQKILSKLTSTCSNYFNLKREYFLPGKKQIAEFDCRIYQAPTLNDACLQLLWRENDATRNSILMLAQSLFSHKQVQGLNTKVLQDKMLRERNVNWNDLDIGFKKGTFVKRVKTSEKFTKDEIEHLPEKHKARQTPNLTFERSKIKVMEYPIFNKISNREDVIFNDKEPLMYD